MKIIKGLVYTDKQYIEQLETIIKELEEKNKTFEDLNNQLDKLEEENSSLRSRLIYAEQKYIELKEQSFSGYYIDRVNKAIEYIHNNQPVFELSSKEQLQEWFEKEYYVELLKILKGEENESN